VDKYYAKPVFFIIQYLYFSNALGLWKAITRKRLYKTRGSYLELLIKTLTTISG